MEIASRIKREVMEFAWFTLSTPLVFLILCGHFLSKFNVFLCGLYFSILKGMKHEDMR